MSSFDVITGHPFAYWISDIESKIFKESNKSKISSFDNYIYSSSSVDNMDSIFHF